jgi:tetratricopeptide (TPR) repeat protein
LSGQWQLLIILLLIAVVAGTLSIWQLSNLRGYKTRGRRRNGPTGKSAASTQRRSDKRNLTAPEKRLYKEAQRMLRENKIPAAARIFEQLGMPREAIQCLEDAKMINEAASILIRMQRHNRAGVIYARHGMWNDAAQCFKTAGMPAEAAKCYREAGSHAAAGQFFEAAGRLDDAANSFEEAGEFLRAARLLFRLNQRDQALPLYIKAAKKTKDISALDIREDELNMLVSHIAEGRDDNVLIAIVVAFNRIGEVIISLLENNQRQLAGKLYTKSVADIGPLLMAETNYGDDSARKLADMFLDVSSFDYAGRVLERLEEFEAAADAFEKAEDFDRAAHCYERAGNYQKLRSVKAKGRSAAPKQKHGNKGFALANVADSTSATSTTSGDGSEDSTAIVEIARIAGNANHDQEEVTAEPSSIPEIPPAPPVVEKQQIPVIHEVPMPPPTNGNDNFGNFSLSDIAEETPAKPAQTPKAPPAVQIPVPPIATVGTPVSIPTATPPPIPVPQAGSQERTPAPVSAAPETEHTAPVVPEPLPIDDGRASFHRAKFFADLDYRQKNKLWDIGRTIQLGASETILSYNDEPEGIYVILSGNVSCYKHVKDSDSYVDRMGEAESFGELWLLADQPTTVKFVASTPTAIRVIDRNSFNELLDSDGSIARKLYKRFTMRLLKRLLKPQIPNKNQAAS